MAIIKAEEKMTGKKIVATSGPNPAAAAEFSGAGADRSAYAGRLYRGTCGQTE